MLFVSRVLVLSRDRTVITGCCVVTVDLERVNCDPSYQQHLCAHCVFEA